MWFLKIAHHIIRHFGEKNWNTKFRFCRRILDISGQWLFKKQIESSDWKDLKNIYPEKESENACTENGQTRESSNPKKTMTKIPRSLCLFTDVFKDVGRKINIFFFFENWFYAGKWKIAIYSYRWLCRPLFQARIGHA